MSNNSFGFADQLRVSSALRRRFVTLCEEYGVDVSAEDIEQYGAEDAVVTMMEMAPERMQEFGVY